MEVCTIIAKNYVAHARVLAKSLASQQPGSRLWALIIDDFERYIDPADEPFEVLTPADIDCEPFTYMALRYSVLELSTAVKPWLLRHLIDLTEGPVTYLDPDIKIYGPLDRLDELASRHGVVLIPHTSEPIPADGRKPSQVDVMISGVYNLGYVSLAPRPEVEHLLDWWADRLRRDCRVDPIWGYFVDQRWFDLVPGFMSDFAILREPEYNVAYWNLHGRHLAQGSQHYLVDGKPLAFFHFSGFDATRPLSLSRYQNRLDVTEDPVLERLLSEYAREVMDQGHAISRNWPYGYRTLGDGTEIDDLVRSFSDEFEDDQQRRGAPAASLFTLSGARAFLAWLAEDVPRSPAGVNRVLERLYQERSDLQLRFPDLQGGDLAAFLRWAEEFGRDEFPLLDRVLRATGDVGVADRSTYALRSAVTRTPLTQLPASPWGINLVGHFHSQTEFGESARQLLALFDDHGISSAPIQDWGIPLVEERQPFETLSPESAPYVVNLICTDPDALPEFVRGAGERFLAGRYSIGLWLTDQPPVNESFAFVQEVWVPTGWAASLLTPSSTVPVATIPLPVEPMPVDTRSRLDLGLPDDDKCLFMASLGQEEELERMNPLAVIEAFKAAFPDGDRAHLAIVIGARHRDAAFEELRAAASSSPLIQVIDSASTRSERIELISACDAYVSLHRAEPFGRSLAEAMWLGKPVVATRYSGNLDFMTDENSLLVGCHLVSKPGGSYVGEQMWAEPDVNEAATHLRRVFDNRAGLRALGDRAAIDIRRTHSAAACAEVIGRRLQAIQGAGLGPPVAAARTRSRAVAQVMAQVNTGPARGPRAGSHRRLRGALRKAILRGLRPYTAYQQQVNVALLNAIDKHEEQGTSSVEQAQLVAEVRALRRQRTALEAQARSLDERERKLEPRSDHSPDQPAPSYLDLGSAATVATNR